MEETNHHRLRMPEGLGLGSLRRLTTSAGGLPGGEFDVKGRRHRGLFLILIRGKCS